jgi:hypothetical protein
MFGWNAEKRKHLILQLGELRFKALDRIVVLTERMALNEVKQP